MPTPAKKSFFYTLTLFLRSLLFSTLMIVVTILYSALCLAYSVLPLRYRYANIVRYNRFILWLLENICGIHYKVEGLDNIPQDYSGVVLSKHQSTWETLLLPTLFFQPAIILKKELFWVPFFGWGLATIDPIAINRTDTISAMDQIIRKGKQCLDAGRWILVFPEGTRIPVGKAGKYRLGGARLAVATGRPVIPVAHNAGVFWPRRKFLKYPGTVQVVIGSLIATQDRKAEDIMEEVKLWIEKTVGTMPIAHDV